MHLSSASPGRSVLGDAHLAACFHSHIREKKTSGRPKVVSSQLYDCVKCSKAAVPSVSPGSAEPSPSEAMRSDPHGQPNRPWRGREAQRFEPWCRCKRFVAMKGNQRNPISVK